MAMVQAGHFEEGSTLREFLDAVGDNRLKKEDIDWQMEEQAMQSINLQEQYSGEQNASEVILRMIPQSSCPLRMSTCQDICWTGLN